MALKDYMMDGEEVEATFSEPGGTWMATSERVALYGKAIQSEWFGLKKRELEVFKDINYSEIRSVELVVDNNPLYKKIAIALIVLGILGYLITNEVTMIPELVELLSAVSVLTGIFIFIFGTSRSAYRLKLKGDTVLLSDPFYVKFDSHDEELQRNIAAFLVAVRERTT